MNKITVYLAFIAVLAGSSRAFPAVVISESSNPSQFTANTVGDHSRFYQVITANVGDWPGWYINSLTVGGFGSSNPSFDPSSDTFTLRFYNASGVRIGSEYTDTATSALSSTATFGRYFFTVTFDLPTETIIVPDASSFYYSVASASGLNMFTRPANANYGNGWGTGMGWAGAINTGGYLGNLTTGGLTLDATMVPEPSAFSLLVAGLGGLAILRRRRK